MRLHPRLRTTFLFAYILLAFFWPGFFDPATAQDTIQNEPSQINDASATNIECTQRCVALGKKCTQFVENEEASPDGKQVCKAIFSGKKSYCASLCASEEGLFNDCEINDDDFRVTDDCFDDCDHHNAMCQINCLNQYKQAEELKLCAFACRTAFTEENSFCRTTCENDVNAFVTCEE